MSAGRPPGPFLPPPDRPARVLLVKLSALGDVAHALPVLVALRRSLPGAEVDWAVEDRCADLLRGRSDLSRVVVFPRREMDRLRRARRAFALSRLALGFLKDLRARTYDLALDLQGNLKSGLVVRASGARRRVGFAPPDAREGSAVFVRQRVRVPRAVRHRVPRNLALLAAALGRPVAWEDPGLPVAAEADAAFARALSEAGLPERGFALLHPGTSAFGAFKRWPPARFADLALRLAGRGLAVAVSAPPGEEPLAGKVAELSAGAARAVPVAGLSALSAAVRRAGLVVAADTGALHLAALAGTPCLGLYGPKDPAVYGPWGDRPGRGAGPHPVVVRADVACRPCRLRHCEDPVCMTGLAAEAVVAALAAAGWIPAALPGSAPAPPTGVPRPAAQPAEDSSST